MATLDLGKRTNIGLINDEIWELHSLNRIGKHRDSFTLTVPKLWVEFYCEPNKEGKYWVGLEQDGDVLKIKAYKGEAK